jgi:hypothetical protein
MLADSLRTKTMQLTAKWSGHARNLAAWETIYRDFKVMQQRLMTFEQSVKALALERDALREQLERRPRRN